MFHIYASLEDQMPTLKVIDAESQKVILFWQYNPKNKSNNGTQHKENDRKEIQHLFKELILLTCKQQAVNSRVFSCLEADDTDFTLGS
jgi:hypothetical protein